MPRIEGAGVVVRSASTPEVATLGAVAGEMEGQGRKPVLRYSNKIHRPFPAVFKQRGRCAAFASLAANTVRLLFSFPMVTVLSTSAQAGAAAWRTPLRVLLLNTLCYTAPFVALVTTVSVLDLSGTPSYVANMAISGYILYLLLPVCLSLAANIRRLHDERAIPAGTFCFRPAHRLRRTRANAQGVLGILLEFVQLTFFVLPRGVLENEGESGGQVRSWMEMRPRVSYELQFWVVVTLAVFQVLVVIARVLAKGHAAYMIATSRLLWLAVYMISGPLYVSIAVCLIRALDCDYNASPPRLYADTSIVCWSNEDSRHSGLVAASLLCLALYLPQATLMPSGTYKETMRNEKNNVLFVPLYLQAHFLLKGIFCVVYATMTEMELERTCLLTAISVFLLALNEFVDPCAVSAINRLRSTSLTCTAWAGVVSVVALKISDDGEVDKPWLFSMVCSGLVIIGGSKCAKLLQRSHSATFKVLRAMHDLELSEMEATFIHPRCLEPLVALSNSKYIDDLNTTIRFMPFLAKLLLHPSNRVKFQACWCITNLAALTGVQNYNPQLSRRSRSRAKSSERQLRRAREQAKRAIKLLPGKETLDPVAAASSARHIIHTTGEGAEVLQRLFKLAAGIDTADAEGAAAAVPGILKTQALAAIINLSAEPEIARVMVKDFGAISLFIHALRTDPFAGKFAGIGLANLAQTERHRDEIRDQGGLSALLASALAKDLQRTQNACLALTNMSLSSAATNSVFLASGVIERMMRIIVYAHPAAQNDIGVMLCYLIVSGNSHVLRKMVLCGVDEFLGRMVKRGASELGSGARDWRSRATSIGAASKRGAVSKRGSKSSRSAGRDGTVGFPIGGTKAINLGGPLGVYALNRLMHFKMHASSMHHRPSSARGAKKTPSSEVADAHGTPKPVLGPRQGSLQWDSWPSALDGFVWVRHEDGMSQEFLVTEADTEVLLDASALLLESVRKRLSACGALFRVMQPPMHGCLTVADGGSGGKSKGSGESSEEEGHVFRYLPEEGFEGEDHITLKAFADPPITMHVRVTVYHADLQRQQQADDERRQGFSSPGSPSASSPSVRHLPALNPSMARSMSRQAPKLVQGVPANSAHGNEEQPGTSEAALPTHQLNVVVVQAKGLLAIDRHLIGGRSSDPFVELSWNQQEGRTTYKKTTCAPFWGELSCFSVGSMAELLAHGELDVVVKDYDTMGLGFSGGFLGCAKVPLSDMREGHETQAWYPLVGSQGETDVDRGMVELRLMVYERPRQATNNPLRQGADADEVEAQHVVKTGKNGKGFVL